MRGTGRDAIAAHRRERLPGRLGRRDGRARRGPRVAAVLLGVAASFAALAAAASHVSILVVDLPGHRGTLLVERSSVPGLRLLDSPEAVCRRQGPGSPLRSIYLGDDFCQRAVLLFADAGGRRAGARLPYSRTLHALAGR